MRRIKLLLIPALCAMLAFSACKKCKDCRAYDSEDGGGNPVYETTSVEKCGDNLEDAEDAMTDPLVGTSHHAWNCD